jgi:hypothetical protein
MLLTPSQGGLSLRVIIIIIIIIPTNDDGGASFEAWWEWSIFACLILP